MSHFIKSLQTRIHELNKSIEAQKTELNAYEHILQIETSKGNVSAVEISVEAPAKATPVHSAPAPSGGLAHIKTGGSKTTLIAEIVMAHGGQGASPKEVDQFFSARKIKRSKNLIYNTLSYLVAQKKLQRRDGRYFALGGAAIVQKVAASPSAPAATPTKRRLSPAGLKRIREALKKRWAAKRAADKGAGK
jgi:hypothetical protein